MVGVVIATGGAGLQSLVVGLLVLGPHVAAIQEEQEGEEGENKTTEGGCCTYTELSESGTGLTICQVQTQIQILFFF